MSVKCEPLMSDLGVFSIYVRCIINNGFKRGEIGLCFTNGILYRKIFNEQTVLSSGVAILGCVDPISCNRYPYTLYFRVESSLNIIVVQYYSNILVHNQGSHSKWQCNFLRLFVLNNTYTYIIFLFPMIYQGRII